MSNLSNPPQSDHSGGPLFAPNLKHAVACPWQESSDGGARPANGGEDGVRTNSRPTSVDVPDGRQVPVMSNSRSEAALRLVQSAGEQLRNFEFMPGPSPASVDLERGTASERTIPRGSRDD